MRVASRFGSWSRKRRLICFLGVLMVALIVSSCAEQPAPSGEPGVPGFLYGLLHGFLIVIDFFIGLFSDVRIYAYPNSGGWYDFGFVLGASMFLGGGGAGSRGK
jgi:hypothetical protein